jgi:serine/threonine protein kinase
LSTKKSAFFYYQLINGIEYIHKKGVCHRDLKPENLLLTEKNKLKIIDFGLSNYFNGNLLETPCGSPCYASPEMVRGHKYDGFKIDIWSSGIILYAMLCGYLPFEEMENDDCNEVLFKNIMECNVEYPPEFIPPEAKSLLKKILVKDPRRRITIEEIKMENFYLLGEIIYKQTFENLGNIDLNEYIYCIDDKDKFYNYDEYPKNVSNDNLLEKEYLYFNEKMRKNQEDFKYDLDKQKSLKKEADKEKEKDKDKEKEKEKDNNKDKPKVKDLEEKDIIVQKTEPNKFMTPIKSEGDEDLDEKSKKSAKKSVENYDKDEMSEKIKKMTAEKKSQKHQKHFDQKAQIENKENINSQEFSEKKTKTKIEKSSKPTNENPIKKISPDMLCNIPLITCSNEKKDTKDDKLKKEYSLQEEYNKINNENSNMI